MCNTTPLSLSQKLKSLNIGYSIGANTIPIDSDAEAGSCSTSTNMAEFSTMESTSSEDHGYPEQYQQPLQRQRFYASGGDGLGVQSSKCTDVSTCSGPRCAIGGLFLF